MQWYRTNLWNLRKCETYWCFFLFFSVMFLQPMLFSTIIKCLNMWKNIVIVLLFFFFKWLTPFSFEKSCFSLVLGVTAIIFLLDFCRYPISQHWFFVDIYQIHIKSLLDFKWMLRNQFSLEFFFVHVLSQSAKRCYKI